MTHTPFQPWCKFCVMSRPRANQHPHVADPTQDAQREHPTVQCVFFMETGKEDAVVALLMVDTWARYVSVVPLKPRNTQTVGKAPVKFLNEVDCAEKVEVGGGNEPVLAAGIGFCQSARQRLGLETVLTWNRAYEKSRASVAERFLQTIRRLQKTLMCHLETAMQASIPAGHAMIQWAAMHAAWIYSRFQVHVSLKVTPFQSLFGRPYRGRIIPFGQVVFGLDPKADKYHPAWVRGAWLGKDLTHMDLLATDGQSVIRTKAVRRIGEESDAILILRVEITPRQVFQYIQMKRKQKVTPLDAPIPQAIDEETEAVRDYESEGCSASEPANDHGENQQAIQDGTQTWEKAGLENPMSPAAASSANMEFEQGGGVPVTPLDMASEDDDAEIPTSSTKHLASTP